MRLSFDWLSDHVDLGGLSPEEVGERITLHVAEVDEVAVPGGGWPGVVVGEVLGVRPHPDADRLCLVRVDSGSGESEVVCGAPNVAAGQKICFAPEGTVLPGGLKLKRARIRGVDSAGMVLSERELGIGDDHDGILVLADDLQVGTPAAEALPGGAVIEVDNTAITTRPDLWGHYGFARELAAVLDRELSPLDLGDEPPDEEPQVLVRIDAPDLCPRYLGWVIAGVKVEPSPEWLKRRLEEAGQRPINNVVDLTNYILLECGQPLHAFDRRQIAGDRIIVRRAGEGERVVTLDGVERTLMEGSCVIADPDRAVALGGVMGLANSEVMDDTTEMILEVANFEMTGIRKVSKALGLRTESAVRFEKGLDAEGVLTAARRFVRLLTAICPTAHVLGGPCDVRSAPIPPRRIELTEGWIERRLGTRIGRERIDRILSSLGFGVDRVAGGHEGPGRLTITVPSWRAGRDISLPEDLLEEVGRVHGYDKIEPIPLEAALDPVDKEPEREARRLVRAALSGAAGLSEVHLYPVTTADRCRRAGLEPPSLRLANADQPGLDLMVGSLVPDVLRIVGENLRYRSEAAVYQVAPIFLPGEPGASEGLPRENERVVLAIARRDGADAVNPVLEIKGAVETVLGALRVRGARLVQEEGPAWLHPGRSARFARGKQVFGWFGEAHPVVARAFDIDATLAMADLDLDLLRCAMGAPPRMGRIGRFPTVPYDVALIVDRRLPAAEIEKVLGRVDDELVRSVELFDVYEGPNLPEGKRSLAFRVTFGSFERTLDGEDVERLRSAVTAAIARQGWILRE